MTSQRAKPSFRPPRRRFSPRAVATSIFFVLVAAGLTWLFYPALVRGFTSESERYRLDGDSFLAEGRIPEAVLSYWQSVAADPNNAEALRSLAEVYRQQGRLRTAQRYFRRLREIEGGSSMSVSQAAQPESVSGVLELAWLTPAAEAAPTGGTVQDGRLISAYEDGTVVALDAVGGAEIWRARLPASATSAVSSDGEMAWVGANDGRVYALNLVDGALGWSFSTNGPVYAAPVFDAARVYCPSSDGSLYALEKQTGNMVWKFTTQGALHASPAVGWEAIYFGSMDGKLYALEAVSGAPIWQDGILTGGPIESQPLLYGGRVIFGSGDSRVYSLDPMTGGQYWRVSTSDAVYASPLAVDDTVYVVSSGKSALALDFETGEKLWQAALPAPVRTSPVIRGDTIFLATDADAHLYLFDRASGEITVQADTGDWIATGPILDGEMLYLWGKDGTVIAYRLAD